MNIIRLCKQLVLLIILLMLFPSLVLLAGAVIKILLGVCALVLKCLSLGYRAI
jgi:hypothetical protein